ncbi:hypothetical protein N0A02_16645 [Paraburkholderia acidicola]|uniref:DUF3301 domain-containing protein n=1 Tax=Paraburkholderia acidicola TaxID=1912599 RepID=A0ABV1LQ26_9BURK
MMSMGGYKKVAKIIVTIIVLWMVVNYWTDFELRSKAHECKKQLSDSGLYLAELCLLQWNPGGDSDYLGRVYDAKTGTLLVERMFQSPVPQVSWWKSEYVLFERGGRGSGLVNLPPSLFDRLTAKLP